MNIERLMPEALWPRPGRSSRGGWGLATRGGGSSRAGYRVVVVCGILSYGCLAADPVQPGDPPAVAVINQQAILERTNAGKRALGTLKEFATARQKIIASDDQELKRLEQEIRTHQDSWGEEERRAKQEAFRAKVEAYQRRVQDFNREVQVKQKELADEYRRKIAVVAAHVAASEGYALVVDKGGEAMRIVLYHRTSIDLTDAVVKEFDRRHK